MLRQVETTAKGSGMKPTVFFVIDTETCRFDGMVFDIGWKAIDRKGREYSQGSYLCADVL